MTTESPEFSKRYGAIDEANEKSFYMNDVNRPFEVNMSVHSAGPARQKVEKSTMSDDEIKYVNMQNKAARHVLGGNMSTVVQADGKVPYGPKELDDRGRYDNAVANMNRYFENLDIDPATVRVLNPERDYSTPLTVVNVDADEGVYNGVEPVKLKESGDFIYTYNPDIVLAVRPADCPIAVFSSETPKGRMYGMIHFAWRGPASGQFDDMKKEFEALGVDYSSLDVYITPGGHAETYQFTNYAADGKNNPIPVEGHLFIKPEEQIQEDKSVRYSFGIDTPNAVYEAFRDLGLEDEHIFVDTSDTTALNSGFGSHGRAMRQQEDNVRDLVTVKLHAK